MGGRCSLASRSAESERAEEASGTEEEHDTTAARAGKMGQWKTRNTATATAAAVALLVMIGMVSPGKEGVQTENATLVPENFINVVGLYNSNSGTVMMRRGKVMD